MAATFHCIVLSRGMSSSCIAQRCITMYWFGLKLYCIVIRGNMQGGGTQWPAGLPVTPDLPGFVAATLLSFCCVYVLHLSASLQLYFYHHHFSRICSRLHCGFVPFVSRICQHHLTGCPCWWPEDLRFLSFASDFPDLFERIYPCRRCGFVPSWHWISAVILKINQHWVQMSPTDVNGYEMQPIGGNRKWISCFPFSGYKQRFQFLFEQSTSFIIFSFMSYEHITLALMFSM